VRLFFQTGSVASEDAVRLVEAGGVFLLTFDNRSKVLQTEKRNGQRLDPLTVTDRPTFVSKGWWLPESLTPPMPLANIMHVDCFNRRVMNPAFSVFV
jgi:hypothetical protein